METPDAAPDAQHLPRVASASPAPQVIAVADAVPDILSEGPGR